MVEEKGQFVPEISRYAVAHNILAVSRTRIEGKWGAYIAPVPGENHDKEYQKVLDKGTKLSENVARAIFPRYADVEYAL